MLKKSLFSCTALLIGGILLLSSCEKEEVVRSKNSSTNFNEKSGNKNRPGQLLGEDIFKAVFFMRGPLIDQLPSLLEYKENVNQNTSQNEVLDYDSYIDQIIYEIDNIDKNYFKSLRNTVQAGNPVLIEDRIEHGSTLVIEAISRIEQVDMSSLMLNDPNLVDKIVQAEDPNEKVQIVEDYYVELDLPDASAQGQCLVIGVLIAVYAGVVVHAGAAVHAAVAIDIYAWVALWGPGAETPSSGPLILYQPVMVHRHLDKMVLHPQAVGEDLSLRKEKILLEIANLRK